MNRDFYYAFVFRELWKDRFIFRETWSRPHLYHPRIWLQQNQTEFMAIEAIKSPQSGNSKGIQRKYIVDNTQRSWFPFILIRANTLALYWCMNEEMDLKRSCVSFHSKQTLSNSQNHASSFSRSHPRILFCFLMSLTLIWAVSFQSIHSPLLHVIVFFRIGAGIAT